MEPPHVDLAPLVAASANAGWRQRTGSGLELAAPASPVWVRADGKLVGRVVRELVSNAADAGGGRVRVAVERVALSAPAALAHPQFGGVVPPGVYARVSVSDDGRGVPPEVKRRLFEPFVSTKQPGPGRGLGLATVYGIALAVGWRLDCESEPGRTVFSVFIPAEAAEAEPGAAADGGGM